MIKKLVFACILLFMSLNFLASENRVSFAPKAMSFDSLEVFVSVTAHDKAVYTQVKNAIDAIPGVLYFSYCDNHAVFMIYIDKTVYASTALFKEQLFKLVPDLAPRIDLKSGMSFKEL
ncbi:MAG: hypothetical protein ACXVP0_04615, partial [Bacteroidia bacterium]